MADQDQIYDAIRKADAAGDAEAVRKLAGYLEATQAAPMNTYETRTRQGGKIRFEGPANASDDELRQLAAKATGDTAMYRGARIDRSGAALAAPEQTPGRALGIGTRDVIEGVLSVPDLVAAPLNSLVNLTGTNLSTTPFRDLGRRAADAIGLPVAETGQERTLSAIAQGGASALVPAAAATGALARGGGAIAANLAYKPGAQVVAGGVAGGAADVARDMGAGPVGQAVAGIAGGVVAPVAMTGASQTVRSLASLASREGALDTAARTLKSLAIDPVRAASRIRYAPEQVSGAQPTLGEVSRDAGLAGLQRGQANTNPVAAAQIGERMQLNALARTGAVSRALGPGSPQRLQDVGAARLAAAQGDTAAQQALAREALETRLVGTRQQALTEAQAARARVADVAGNIGPVADRAASGSAARKSFGVAYDRAKEATRAAYRVPALQERTPVEIPPDFFSSVRRAADDFYGDGGGLMPPEMVAILDDAAAPGATTRTLANIDRRLADFAGEAGIRGRRAEAAFAQRIRGDFKSIIEQRASRNPVFDLSKSGSKTVGPAEVDYSVRNGNVSVKLIRVPEEARKQGAARTAMQSLLADADARGMTVSLTPDPVGAKGASKTALQKFYRSLGFVANTGRSRDFSISDTMIRSPEPATQTALMPSAYREALDTARATRAEQGRVFETGDAPRAFSPDRYGNPVVGDTTLPTRLVRPGAAGGDTADGLIAAVGPEAAEQTAREEMRRLADGVETGAQAATLIQRHAEMLSRFPTLRADMDRWAATTNDADQAAAAARIAPRATPEETAALSAVSPAERELTGTPLARLADPKVEPSAEVARLLARSDGGRELKRLTSQIRNDREAMDGARRAMAEYVETTGRGPNLTAAGDAVPSPNPTRRAIETVLKRGGNLLNDQQRIVLQKVARELEGVNFASSAGRPAGSETAMNASVSTLIGKQIMGAATGKASMLLTKALSMLGNGEQVQRFITEAILDPSFAADLLRRQTPDRLRAVQDRLRVSAQGASIGGMSSGQRQ